MSRQRPAIGGWPSPRDAQCCGPGLALARTTLENARRSVLELREAPLDGRPLPAALETLVAEHDDVQLTMVGFDEGGPLPPAIELGLYRIAQQALANITQHAGPPHSASPSGP